MKVIILDTETTGLDEPEPIEIAWMEIKDHKTLAVENTFNQLYKPTKAISFGAMAVHHITADKLVDSPLFSGNFGANDSDYMIGHNIDFDWKVIHSPEIKRICTLALSRYMFPDTMGHTLGAMLYRMTSDTEYMASIGQISDFESLKERMLNAHSAYYDCVFTKDLLAYLLYKTTETIDTWEDLYQFSEFARIPEVMPFGKHRGVKISELPTDYCGWLMRQDDMDIYVKRAIDRRFKKHSVE